MSNECTHNGCRQSTRFAALSSGTLTGFWPASTTCPACREVRVCLSVGMNVSRSPLTSSIFLRHQKPPQTMQFFRCGFWIYEQETACIAVLVQVLVCVYRTSCRRPEPATFVVVLSLRNLPRQQVQCEVIKARHKAMHYYEYVKNWEKIT